jgi:hypothetical protein
VRHQNVQDRRKEIVAAQAPPCQSIVTSACAYGPMTPKCRWCSVPAPEDQDHQPEQSGANCPNLRSVRVRPATSSAPGLAKRAVTRVKVPTGGGHASPWPVLSTAAALPDLPAPLPRKGDRPIRNPVEQHRAQRTGLSCCRGTAVGREVVVLSRRLELNVTVRGIVALTRNLAFRYRLPERWLESMPGPRTFGCRRPLPPILEKPTLRCRFTWNG